MAFGLRCDSRLRIDGFYGRPLADYLATCQIQMVSAHPFKPATRVIATRRSRSLWRRFWHTPRIDPAHRCRAYR
jgi:hypothetical protein